MKTLLLKQDFLWFRIPDQSSSSICYLFGIISRRKKVRTIWHVGKRKLEKVISIKLQQCRSSIGFLKKREVFKGSISSLNHFFEGKKSHERKKHKILYFWFLIIRIVTSMQNFFCFINLFWYNRERIPKLQIQNQYQMTLFNQKMKITQKTTHQRI